MSSTSAPSGFRDLLLGDARRRLKLMKMISDVYQSFGFSPLETPVLENLDILLGGGGGEENEKLIFKILKRGGKLEDALRLAAQSEQGGIHENQIAEFGLRFDLTVPLARVVAEYRGKIQLPWKVFHMGPVWRAERPQKGRFREFVQCDVDIIGAKGIGAEIEVIQAVVKAIHQVGGSGFELRINDRRLVEALGAKFGFKDGKLNEFAIILDKKDKISSSEIIEQMNALAGHELSADVLEMIEGKLDLESAAEFHAEAGNDLKNIISILSQLHLPLTNIIFDPSLVRGMGYYTGPVFELRHASAGYSFGGGGRYDRMIGRLLGQDVAAVGFSLGFERLALLLAEKETQSEAKADVLFIPVFSEDLRFQTLELASHLRSGGIQVDVYPDRAKIKNQFKYASDGGYRWVLIAGAEEWQSKTVKLKDFKGGEEISLPISGVLSHLQGLFAGEG